MILPVYFEEHLVGEVHENADGPRFVYAASWTEDRQAFPISITMPLGEREVEPARFLTWASNLLPEAEQLVVIARQLGVAQTDILALLEAIGRDTAGALSFGAPGLTRTERWQRIEKEHALEAMAVEQVHLPPDAVGARLRLRMDRPAQILLQAQPALVQRCGQLGIDSDEQRGHAAIRSGGVQPDIGGMR